MFANTKRLREFLEQLKTLVNHNACNRPKVHERILDLGYSSGWNLWYLPGTKYDINVVMDVAKYCEIKARNNQIIKHKIICFSEAY